MVEHTDRSEKYLKTLIVKHEAGKLPVSSGCPIIDAVLSQKYLTAQANKININVKAVSPESLQIINIDLGSLLSNVLDNAIEAAVKIPDQAQRYIKVEIRPENQNLLIKVINSIHEPPIIKDGVYLSSKSNLGKMGQKHGMGLKNVEDIIKKYDGNIMIQVENAEFILTVSL